MLNWYSQLAETMHSSLPAHLIWLRGILLSQSYGGEAHQSYVPVLLDYLASYQEPSNPMFRLSPLIYAKLGRVDACQTRLEQLVTQTDVEFLKWLRKIDCKTSSQELGKTVPGTEGTGT